jgi:anhydro-N-acetylmuramic acid kinase
MKNNAGEISYRVIGLMSGTSLDGLDIAGCTFTLHEGTWHYQIHCAETIAYEAQMKERLLHAHEISALELAKLHVDLGMLHGTLTKKFIEKNNFNPDFISSHGHTVFHQPEIKLTLQIGSPAHIASICNKMVIADFRSQDVALGGQGAPLVPVGDKLLFTDYKYCLNLGGVANISIKESDRITAFDISLCNIPLNYLASKTGQEYDENGATAASGKIIRPLLDELNASPFYQKIPPKSLGREFFELEFLPVLTKYEATIPDLLATVSENIAMQIARVLDNSVQSHMLVTGGGAFNQHLISRLTSLTKTNVVLPERQIISFKEALIFAFLGVLRHRNEANCLSQVTGAPRDHVSGAIY